MLYQQLINQATYWLIAIGLWGISLCAVAVPILNPDNGHYYEKVVNDSGITISDAKGSAWRSTFKGVTGHLITHTDSRLVESFLIGHSKDFSDTDMDVATNLWSSECWIGAQGVEYVNIQLGTSNFLYYWNWDSDPANIYVIGDNRAVAMKFVRGSYDLSGSYHPNKTGIQYYGHDDNFSLKCYIVEYDTPRQPQSIKVTTDITKVNKGETATLHAEGGDSGNIVFFQSKTPEICQVDGQTVSFLQGGTCTITANQQGNGVYAPAPEVTLNIEVLIPIAQTITFNKIENQVLKRGLTIKMVATASSGLPVTFESTTPICKSFPPSWLDNDVLTIYNAGTCTIVATQKGGLGFKPAATVTQSFTIAKGESRISQNFALAPIKVNNSLFPISDYFGRVGSTQPFTFSTKSKTCTLESEDDDDYNLRVLVTGTCTLTVNLAGDNDYHAAPEISVDIKVLPLDKQTIIFESKLSDKTFGDPDFTIDAHGSGGWSWTVDFAIANPQDGNCEVNGKTVKITGAGPCLIDAFQKGYWFNIHQKNWSNHPIVEYEKASAHQSFGIHKATQVINFSAPNAGVVGESAELKATKKGAPTPVSFSSTTRGVCTVGTDAMNSRGDFVNTVKFVGEGTCTVTAKTDGDINYKPTSETRDITVKKPKKPQTITFNQLAGKAFGDADFTIAATASSGLPVSFSTGEGSSGCSITDHTVKITGVGICIVYAGQAGNDQYLPALTKAQQFKIAKANQLLKFETANTGSLGAVMNLSATGGASGNPVVFSSDSDICDVVLGDTNFIDNKLEESYVVRFWGGEGTCTVIASQAGDDLYNDAQVEANITVTKPKKPKREQTIILGESLKSLDVDVKYGDQVKLSAMSTPSSLPVIFATETGSKGCSITGDTLKMTGVGTCILKMDQPGNAEYNPAPTAILQIRVEKEAQVMTLSKFSPTAEVGAATILSATGGASGNSVRFYTQTPRVCTVDGNVVTFVAPGKCTLLINQAGNAFYYEAQWARYNNDWLRYLNITVTAATQPSVTPATPESRVITTPVSNSGRTATDMTVTDTGSISGGTLCGHTTNSGSVFGVTICESGQVTNCSNNNAAGIMRNVTLNPNTTLRCGKVAGEVVCKSPETSVLENLTITGNSRLVDCKIGENVVFEENVVLTDTQNEGCSSTVK